MMHHRFVDLDGGMGQMKTRTLQDHAASRVRLVPAPHDMYNLCSVRIALRILEQLNQVPC